MTDPTGNTLALLRTYMEQGDYMGAREALETHDDAEFARRIAALRDTDQIAQAWGVGKRRVQAHLAILHEARGIGVQIGRERFLPAHLVDHYRPGPVGRPKKARDV